MKPVIILVRPQMGENIGAAARIMMNFGFEDLRIVAPRDGWPNPKANDMASGATSILKNARIFDKVEDSIADLNFIFATTARDRDMAKEIIDSYLIPEYIKKKDDKWLKSGIIFGPERTGLTNSETVLADIIVNIPVTPEFHSINLAQSVAIICYEASKLWHNGGKVKKRPCKSSVAAKKEVIAFFEHLEQELDNVDFFKAKHKKPIMVDNLRNIFQNIELTEQDVRTLRGIIRSLVEGRRN